MTKSWRIKRNGQQTANGEDGKKTEKNGYKKEESILENIKTKRMTLQAFNKLC